MNTCGFCKISVYKTYTASLLGVLSELTESVLSLTVVLWYNGRANIVGIMDILVMFGCKAEWGELVPFVLLAFSV